MVILWNARTGGLLHKLSGHDGWVNTVSYSPDGRRLVSGGDDTTLRLVGRGDEQAALDRTGPHGCGQLRPVQPRGLGVRLVLGGRDHPDLGRRGGGRWGMETAGSSTASRSRARRGGRVGQQRGLQPGRPQIPHQLGRLAAQGVGLYSSGSQVARVSPLGSIALPPSAPTGSESPRLSPRATGTTGTRYESSTPRRGVCFVSSPGPASTVIAAVAFDPGGRLVAGACSDSTVRLWDAGDAREVSVLKGHTQGVFDVAFNHDGRQLATIGWDSTVRLWDVVEGRPIHVFSDIVQVNSDRVGKALGIQPQRSSSRGGQR